MCHLQVLCGQVVEEWDTKPERDERKIFSAFVPLLLAQCILDQFTQFFLTQGTDGVIFEYKMSFHLLCHKRKKKNTNKQEKKRAHPKMML